MGVCQAERLGVALLCQAVDHRAAGVGQAHDFGAFVERFACGVVDRRADDLHIERRIHAYDLRMPAADQQAEEREAGMGQFAVGQVDEVREDMPLQVVDLDHRDVVRHREPLGERYPDEQRTQQPGAAREGDGVYLRDGKPGLSECRVDHRDDVLLVCPRSQFGDHAAVFYVHGLGGDHVRQQQVVADHGSRRIVARGFDAENCNIHPVFRFF